MKVWSPAHRFIGSESSTCSSVRAMRRILSRKGRCRQMEGKDSRLQGDLQEPGPCSPALKAWRCIHIGEVRTTTAGRGARTSRWWNRSPAAHCGGVKRLVFVSSLTVAGIPLAIRPRGHACIPGLRTIHEYKRKARPHPPVGRSGARDHPAGVVYGRARAISAGWST